MQSYFTVTVTLRISIVSCSLLDGSASQAEKNLSLKYNIKCKLKNEHKVYTTTSKIYYFTSLLLYPALVRSCYY